jgi:hypothetical protein
LKILEEAENAFKGANTPTYVSKTSMKESYLILTPEANDMKLFFAVTS